MDINTQPYNSHFKKRKSQIIVGIFPVDWTRHLLVQQLHKGCCDTREAVLQRGKIKITGTQQNFTHLLTYILQFTFDIQININQLDHFSQQKIFNSSVVMKGYVWPLISTQLILINLIIKSQFSTIKLTVNEKSWECWNKIKFWIGNKAFRIQMFFKERNL